MSSPDEHTLEELDEIIFAAVCCHINASALIRRRNELAAASHE